MSSLHKEVQITRNICTDPELGNESGESSILTSSQVSKLEKRILGVSIVARGAFPGVIKIEGHCKTICTAASDFAVRRDAEYFRDVADSESTCTSHIYMYVHTSNYC